MPTVFLHGLGQTPAAWEKTMDALAVPAVCLDLPALLRDGETTYARLYEAVSACLADIPGPLDLCGLSLGGILALHYGIQHPERVRSLVLIGTQYVMPKRLLALQNAVFRFMPERAFQETGFGKREFMQLAKSMADLDFSGALERATCPVLVLCGERDRANRRAAGELAELLRGFWKL